MALVTTTVTTITFDCSESDYVDGWRVHVCGTCQSRVFAQHAEPVKCLGCTLDGIIMDVATYNEETNVFEIQ